MQAKQAGREKESESESEGSKKRVAKGARETARLVHPLLSSLSTVSLCKQKFNNNFTVYVTG